MTLYYCPIDTEGTFKHSRGRNTEAHQPVPEPGHHVNRQTMSFLFPLWVHLLKQYIQSTYMDQAPCWLLKQVLNESMLKTQQ
jgi:hypothetical protein